MTESKYPVGTLVKHMYFAQGMGIITETDAIEWSVSLGYTVHWFDLNEDRREMEWELISIEEIDND